jgi:transitional endoplasmic reticulum ATPase
LIVSAELKVYGRIDLDGTHGAIIETDLPAFESLFKQNNNKLNQTIKLEHSKRTCGCIINELKLSSANRIYLDRFKQSYLQLKDGDVVIVEISDFPIIKKIELYVPTDFSERYLSRLYGKPMVKGEKTAYHTFSGEPRLIIVSENFPKGIGIIDKSTKVITSIIENAEVPISYKDIGGLNREIKLIREIIEHPLRFPELFEHLGVSQPRGVILHGPPGTGKTLIAKALANEIGAKFYSISGPEIYSMWYGKSEENLRNIFDKAIKSTPSVIVIDELDALAPKREKTHGDLEQRIVATFLTQMDGLKQMKGVVVIGTTNRINSIDPALRRGGRFEYEIHIGVPDIAGRKEILEIHTRKMPLSPDVNMGTIAEKTVGFVGSDIASLCREAAYNAIRRSFSQDAFIKGEIEIKEDLKINQTDFDTAIQTTPPSAIREFLIEIPKVSWKDIGGLDSIKQVLIENIVYAITKREVFLKVGVKPAKGILLYGLPGTGKTLLAKAIATESGANFISVKGPDIRSKWFGESEEKIRFIFTKAREVAPCVIFFDEIDATAPVRGRDTSGATDTIVNQILSEMDGIESIDGIIVIGATNRPEMLDPALLRPGRFDYQIEIPLPDAATRKAIFDIHLKEKPIAQDVKIAELVEMTEKYSGAEIAGICREAIWDAIREVNFEADNVKITMAHLKQEVAKMEQTRDKLKPRQIGFISQDKE